MELFIPDMSPEKGICRRKKIVKLQERTNNVKED